MAHATRVVLLRSVVVSQVLLLGQRELIGTLLARAGCAVGTLKYFHVAAHADGAIEVLGRHLQASVWVVVRLSRLEASGRFCFHHLINY